MSEGSAVGQSGGNVGGAFLPHIHPHIRTKRRWKGGESAVLARRAAPRPTDHEPPAAFIQFSSV